jgi:Zn-dependent protease
MASRAAAPDGHHRPLPRAAAGRERASSNAALNALPQASVCAGCGGELAPGFLECPACHRLVYGAELTRLASLARAAETAGDLTTALGTWRKAVELLPVGTSQRKTIDGEMKRLGAVLGGRGGGATNAAAGGGGGRKKAGLFAGAGAIGAAILANAKLLLLGLFKLPTLLSMVWYASATGGRGIGLSLGIVACIYVHEIGHVATLRRYGIEASAPMFVPGFGAFVRMKQYPTDAHEEARTGLAGPLWGLFASGVALLIGVATGSATALQVGSWSASINCFNLIPVWQLDGARGLKALSTTERYIVGGIALAAAASTRQWMPGIVGVVVLGRALLGRGHPVGDKRMLALFSALAILHPLVAWLADTLRHP